MNSTPLRNVATPGTALAAWLLTLAAAGQEPRPKPTEQFPANPRPSFFVRLDVNHETRSYREGDGLVLTAVSEQDCYAYVIYHQADGQSFQDRGISDKQLVLVSQAAANRSRTIN